MTGQDIKEIVEEKCKLIDKVEAENPGLKVFAVSVEDLPLQALREYAEEKDPTRLNFVEGVSVMRYHHSSYKHCVFLDSVKIKVETHIVEDYAVKNV